MRKMLLLIEIMVLPCLIIADGPERNVKWKIPIGKIFYLVIFILYGNW